MPAARIAEIVDSSRATVYNWANDAGLKDHRPGASNGPQTSDVGTLRTVIERTSDLTASELTALVRQVERGFDKVDQMQLSVTRLVGLLEGFIAGEKRSEIS